LEGSDCAPTDLTDNTNNYHEQQKYFLKSHCRLLGRKASSNGTHSLAQLGQGPTAGAAYTCTSWKAEDFVKNRASRSFSRLKVLCGGSYFPNLSMKLKCKTDISL
jgi:hypothetical protein